MWSLCIQYEHMSTLRDTPTKRAHTYTHSCGHAQFFYGYYPAEMSCSFVLKLPLNRH